MQPIVTAYERVNYRIYHEKKLEAAPLEKCDTIDYMEKRIFNIVTLHCNFDKLGQAICLNVQCSK